MRHSSNWVTIRAQDLPLSTQDGGLLKNTRAGGAAARTQNLPFPAIAAGVATSADGKTLYIANMQNDSVSVVDIARRRVLREIRFFAPGSRTPRGEYPFWVVAKCDATGAAVKIYTSSLRDGEIIVTSASGQREIKVGGEPNKMVLAPDGRHLYVANGDLDAVDVIDTLTDRVEQTISLLRPGFPVSGSKSKCARLESAWRPALCDSRRRERARHHRHGKRQGARAHSNRLVSEQRQRQSRWPYAVRRQHEIALWPDALQGRRRRQSVDAATRIERLRLQS